MSRAAFLHNAAAFWIIEVQIEPFGYVRTNEVPSPLETALLQTQKGTAMGEIKPAMTQQIGDAVTELQRETTGHAPSTVSVVLSGDTLVVTMHDALSPAEKLLAANPVGASQVQEFHRQLFASSSALLRRKLRRITGRDVSETSSGVETSMSAVTHTFVTGTIVQMFLLSDASPADSDHSHEPRFKS